MTAKEYKSIFIENAKELEILVVDDNLNTLKILQSNFERYFKRVRIARDGIEALKIYDVHKDTIDIIITDISMPKLNGIGLIKHVRQHNLEIPILVLTANTDEDLLIELINSGVDAFVQKPISSEILSRQLLRLTSRAIDKKAIAVYQKGMESYFDELMRLQGKHYLYEKTLKALMHFISEEELSYINSEFQKQKIDNSLLLKLAGEKIKETLISTPQATEKGGLKEVNLEASTPKIEGHIRERIDARSYLESIEFDKYCKDIMDDILLLGELAGEIYEMLDSDEESALNEIGTLFERYSTIMNMFVEFQLLANNIQSIGLFLKNLDIKNIDANQEKISLFKSLIGALLIDIERWKDSIFITKDALDIHYWDHQIESLAREITSFFDTKDDDEDGGDIIFF